MPASGQTVGFSYLPYATYESAEKDGNKIYFTSDTAQLFVGEQEYTRPVLTGDTLPETLLPPDSLFYHEEQKVLYLSKDGEEWTPVSNFYVHPEIEADETTDEEDLAFGATFTTETVTLDECGHVTAINTTTFTLPDITVEDATEEESDGNAVTEITYEDGVISYVKGTKFVSQEEFDETIAGITSFTIDAGPDGTGYNSLDQLERLKPEGESGVIYLVKADGDGSNNYSEYLWIGDSYEMFGTFGDVDLSNYVTKSTTINGHSLESDIELTKDDIGLENVDNTADADKEVKSAGSLTNPIDVELTGDATGKVEGWDGSEDLVIETEVNHATAADTATEADHATESDHATEADTATTADSATEAEHANTADAATTAEQDSEGNVISEVYATKEEVEEATLVWEVLE